MGGTENQVEIHKQIARHVIEDVWNAGKLDLLDDLMAGEIVAHLPILSTPVHGIEAYKTAVKQYRTVFPDFQIDIDDIIAVDDKVVQRCTLRATHTGTFMGLESTGTEIEVMWNVIVRFEENKYAEEWTTGDILGTLYQRNYESTHSMR